MNSFSPVSYKQLAKFHTPFLFIQKSALQNNYRSFVKFFPTGSIFYSVKANNTASVLSVLARLGSNYDIASWEEIKLLKSLGVAPSRMVFSAPSKIPNDIIHAHKYGVDRFAFDSRTELDKLSHLAPGSKVFARMIVDNAGSEWPLVRKFGLTMLETVDLMRYATQKQLVPYGLSFHVGSQNLLPDTWALALERVHDVWSKLLKLGIRIPIINIGGGFPARYTKNVPQVSQIAEVINNTVTRLFKDEIHLFIEPGRGMVANTGILGASVINRAKRGLQEWVYLDIGVYNGFQETLEGFRYEIVTDKIHIAKKRFIVCGPTCDSTDIIMEDVFLPDNLTIGDKVYFLSTGAYTTSYQFYNGFHYPQTIIKNI